MGLPTLPKKLPRKQRLPWMQSRLRRLRYVAGHSGTDQQKARIRQLERAIATLEAKRKEGQTRSLIEMYGGNPQKYK
jgi:polyhydroxyalkanoate synthesis regulator phasin